MAKKSSKRLSSKNRLKLKRAITMTSHKGLTGRKATTSNLRNGQLMRAGGM